MMTDLAGLRRSELACDLCLIGAGAAGITLAAELAGSGLVTILLERGGLVPEEPACEPREGSSVGAPVALAKSRARAFGGSTHLWTGRCARLDPLDFEARPWVRRSGWPIARSDLEPYYRRAEHYCGFDEPWGDDARAIRVAPAIAPPSFDSSRLAPFVWRYAPRGRRIYVNFGKEHRDVLVAARNVRVLLHAALTDLVLADGGDRLQAVVARSPDGEAVRIAARAVILCCGGIDNAVLLLHAAARAGAPLGGDMVGRCFQQHVHGPIAAVEADAALSARLQKMFAIFAARRGVQHETGWTLAPEAQRAERLLNASAFARYQADPESGWESAKSLVRAVRAGRLPPKHRDALVRIVRGADEVTSNALRWAAGRSAIARTRSIELLVDLEQAPDPESRITLSDARDRFGLPLPQVDWRISELERRTAVRFAEILRDEFARLGLGRVTPAEWLCSSRPLAEAPVSETFHHIGATRMSADPSDGVVDADCKVHGVSNLYVAGSSVFPTGGHANPTLTIVALAVRLADHLKATLRR